MNINGIEWEIELEAVDTAPNVVMFGKRFVMDGDECVMHVYRATALERDDSTADYTGPRIG